MDGTGESVAPAHRSVAARALTSRSEPLLERGFLVFMGASLVLILALMPLAVRLDAHIDRKRPMYADLARMAWLQHLSLSQQGYVVPLQLSDGERTVLRGHPFRPSAGVAIEVRRQDDGFCVLAINQYGEDTNRHCYDLADPPAKVDESR